MINVHLAVDFKRQQSPTIFATVLLPPPLPPIFYQCYRQYHIQHHQYFATAIHSTFLPSSISWQLITKSSVITLPKPPPLFTSRYHKPYHHQTTVTVFAAPQLLQSSDWCPCHRHILLPFPQWDYVLWQYLLDFKIVPRIIFIRTVFIDIHRCVTDRLMNWQTNQPIDHLIEMWGCM